MLTRRENVSLRSVVAGTGESTMAVYTYFGGMAGLLGAVRQEGFGRLATRLATLQITDDAVADIAAAGAAYTAVARQTPELYTVMFDGSLPLPDAQAADATLESFVGAVRRAVDSGRFDADLDAARFANEVWMLGHGACMLLVNGVMPFAQIEPIVTAGLVHLYEAAGDERELVSRSVATGWARGLDGA